MRLRPPQPGFGLAWGGDLGDAGAEPTKRRRDLDAALAAEVASGNAAPAMSSAGWAPTTPELLRKIADGLASV